MRDHVKLLGIFNMVIGGLGILAAIGIFALFGGLAGIVGATGAHDSDALVGASIMGGMGVAIAALITLLSLPQIIGGWGLIKFKPWARVLMIVISIINLIHIPIGTAIGVYGIWVLFNDETRRLFDTGGVAGVTAASYGGPAYPGYTAAGATEPLTSYPQNRPPEPPRV